MKRVAKLGQGSETNPRVFGPLAACREYDARAHLGLRLSHTYSVLVQNFN